MNKFGLIRCARCNKTIWWWQSWVRADYNTWKYNPEQGWAIHSKCRVDEFHVSKGDGK